MSTIILEEVGSQRIHVARSGQIWTIGRAPEADIRLNDVTVARRHASLRFDSGAWRIADLHSPSGVYLNSRFVRDLGVLGIGDQVRVGAVLLVVREIRP